MRRRVYKRIFLVKSFKLHRNKNPLEADLEFDHYHSAFPEDEEFGAEIDSRQSYNGLVELSGAHEETDNILKEVMKSFRSGNKFILVFPTINLEGKNCPSFPLTHRKVASHYSIKERLC